MKIAMISGPFTADTPEQIQKNIETAQAYAAKYWRLGYAVICPHTNSGYLFGQDIAEHRFISGYLKMIKHIDLLVVLPGWQDSHGTKGEIQEAITWGKRIYFESPLTT